MGRAGWHSPSVFNKRILLRRVEAFCVDDKYQEVDAIVDYLRSNYPDYSRTKQQPFVRYVHSVLRDSRKEGGPKMSVRKVRVTHGEEEARNLHSPPLKKSEGPRKRERSYQGGSSAASEDGGDEEHGDLSTSSDAIYEEQVDPEFDVTKSMLRMSYAKLSSSKKQVTGEEQEEVIEMEDVQEKTEKVSLVEESDVGTRNEICTSSSSSSSTEEALWPTFKDFGGLGALLEDLKMDVLVPLCHPQVPRCLGVRPTTGILLHGPPGCGKTMLARAIANETALPLYMISAPEIISGVSGGSEEKIRDLFSKAYMTSPSIVFIDEIDGIASKRDTLNKEMERRIVDQLMSCMDQSYRHSNGDAGERPGHVLVIGATNRPEAVDAALRRPGRFDREVLLGVPDEKARAEILSVLTRKLRGGGSFDLPRIARATPGFVGADLVALVNKAGNLAMRRIVRGRRMNVGGDDRWRRPWLPEEMETLRIVMGDFEDAAGAVQPSSRREGFSEIPSVKWDDVGGLGGLRKDFERYVLSALRFPDDHEEFGVEVGTGFLLYGPPGCGKTMIAKAVANEAAANFIHIKGPELLSKYVGESESAVRAVFRRARTCAPCILFFDEVDALTTRRGSEGGWVVERLVNQLLIELDGADRRRGVFVIGATNRPELIDPAFLRPGRFEKLVYVPLPSPEERASILFALTRNRPVDPAVDLNALAHMSACNDFCGADLAALVKEAGRNAMEEKQRGESGGVMRIGMVHFEKALAMVKPSVSKKQQDLYLNMSRRTLAFAS